MAFSGLCQDVVLSPYHNNGRKGNHVIDSVAIHCMAGILTAYSCGVYFQKEWVPVYDANGNTTGKMRHLNASSNYGVGNDGSICGYVDEDNQAWTTSCGGVDCRAITIEVSNSETGGFWPVSEAAYNSLLNLLTDICTRHNMYLRWAADKDYAIAASKGGPVDKQNMFVHRWFSAKSCPGDYLYERHGAIADEVNRRLRSGGMKIPLFKNSGGTGGKSTCVFIGDSRTVSMHTIVDSKYGKDNDPHIWSCEVGKGLSWMQSTGVPNVESRISSNTAVVIMMGINDFKIGASRYAAYINSKSTNWISKGADVYYVSVNPVSPSGNSSGISNSEIMIFNTQLRNSLDTSIGWIDTYSSIVGNLKTASDGINYLPETTLEIYDLIISAIRRGSYSSDGSWSYTSGVTLLSNSAAIGGVPISIDYTKLNPYVVMIDRTTNTNVNFYQMSENQIVGAILEAGYLYSSPGHNKVKFKQPNFDILKKKIDKSSLEVGYFFTARAITTEEAASEIHELYSVLKNNLGKLGVWVKIEFPSSNRAVNDKILDYYYTALVKYGYIRKLVIYATEENLKKISWDKHKNKWILCLIDHVEDESNLKVLLDPEFFDVDLDKLYV